MGTTKDYLKPSTGAGHSTERPGVLGIKTWSHMGVSAPKMQAREAGAVYWTFL